MTGVIVFVIADFIHNYDHDHFCLRFCAFFSLTMVLVSTVTFIISTIDELQMNESGEVKALFTIQISFCLDVSLDIIN